MNHGVPPLRPPGCLAECWAVSFPESGGFHLIPGGCFCWGLASCFYHEINGHLKFSAEQVILLLSNAPLIICGYRNAGGLILSRSQLFPPREWSRALSSYALLSCSFQDNRSSQRQSPPFSKTLPSKPSWPSAKARLASTLPTSTSLPKPQVPPKPKDLEDEVK